MQAELTFKNVTSIWYSNCLDFFCKQIWFENSLNDSHFNICLSCQEGYIFAELRNLFTLQSSCPLMGMTVFTVCLKKKQHVYVSLRIKGRKSFVVHANHFVHVFSLMSITSIAIFLILKPGKSYNELIPCTIVKQLNGPRPKQHILSLWQKIPAILGYRSTVSASLAIFYK
jgi:hypothetical protein